MKSRYDGERVGDGGDGIENRNGRGQADSVEHGCRNDAHLMLGGYPEGRSRNVHRAGIGDSRGPGSGNATTHALRSAVVRVHDHDRRNHGEYRRHREEKAPLGCAGVDSRARAAADGVVAQDGRDNGGGDAGEAQSLVGADVDARARVGAGAGVASREGRYYGGNGAPALRGPGGARVAARARPDALVGVAAPDGPRDAGNGAAASLGLGGARSDARARAGAIVGVVAQDGRDDGGSGAAVVRGLGGARVDASARAGAPVGVVAPDGSDDGGDGAAAVCRPGGVAIHTGARAGVAVGLGASDEHDDGDGGGVVVRELLSAHIDARARGSWC